MDEQCPRKTPSPRKLSVANMLIVVAIIGVVLAVTIEHRRLSQKVQQNERNSFALLLARRSLGEGTSLDGREVDIISIPSRSPNKWTWIIRNNSDLPFQLGAIYEDIPATGLPNRDRGSQAVVRGTSVISVEGIGGTLHCTVAPLDRRQAFTASGGNSIEFWTSAKTRHLAGEDGVETYPTNVQIELLRRTPDEVNAVPSGLGLLVWLDPLPIH